ncbi:MAG: hypothetical protein Q8O82_19220 [Pseudorhodobacter sp.]|nr:hypothetical protein [Pseudorhodobacter sp.]
MTRLFNRLAATGLAIALCAAPVFSQSNNVIEWVPSLTLKVGQSAVVHGVRGKCGAMPSSKKLKTRYFRTGKLTYGKPGMRQSATCGGLTPAVEAVFVATKPGAERFEISNDIIRVTVTQ